MRSLYCYLFILLLALIPAPALSAAEEMQSCLLLNDNTFRFGHVIDFHNGFLYFREKQNILKISPAHFIGIFDSRDRAENSLIILNEPSQLGSISELQPIFDFIYQKAEIIISQNTPRDTLTTRLTQLQHTTTTPKNLLDIRAYKNTLLLCALSRHYQFQAEFREFLDNLKTWKKPAEMDNHTLLCLEIRLKAIEYLYQNPYINN